MLDDLDCSPKCVQIRTHKKCIVQQKFEAIIYDFPVIVSALAQLPPHTKTVLATASAQTTSINSKGHWLEQKWLLTQAIRIYRQARDHHSRVKKGLPIIPEAIYILQELENSQRPGEHRQVQGSSWAHLVARYQTPITQVPKVFLGPD
jgi:hypothetical protein